MNVVNNQAVNIETSEVSIGLGISEQFKQEFSGFLWPATLGAVELLTLSFSANTAIESSERYDFLLSDDVLEIPLSSSQWHFLDGLGCLASVLIWKEVSGWRLEPW